MSDDSAQQQDVRIEPSWKARLGAQFAAPHMAGLGNFLRAEKAAGKRIYPPGSQIFRAFELTPFDEVKVVILGQDPYHGPGQAHGLCFSVRPNVPPPPSLVNIFKEIEDDLGIAPPDHGCLQPWAEQGVLLLNSVLTVVQGQAGAHQGKGWERFTDKVVETVNRHREGVVFLLWGSHARKKGQHIDRRRHLVLEGPHPSPLSAYRGFFGCRHFSKANTWLQQKGQNPIDWALPSRNELLARYRK